MLCLRDIVETMLTGLNVRNIVLIDRLDINFQAGLCVLTGETGAGKSILLDSLMLALGGRGDQKLVRKGSESGQVSAVFSVAFEHEAREMVRQNQLDDDDELILRRVQYLDGRTKALINDQPVSASLLKKIGQLLVEIHGQHDERAMVDDKSHRNLLDVFGGHRDILGRTIKNYGKLTETTAALEACEVIVEAAKRDEEFARFSVEELSKLNAKVGEENELAEKRRLMMALEKAAGEVSDADEILNGGSSPSAVLANLLRRLQRKEDGEQGLFTPLVETLDASLIALEQAGEALEDIKRKLDFDPNELNDVEERLFALRAMARKHDVACDGLENVLESYQNELAAIKSGDDDLKILRAQMQQALHDYKSSATKLSVKRANAAKAIELAIANELPDLKLGAAKFIVDHQIDETKISSNGFDRIAFHVQTNPGTMPGPILKVASGGELSRFLLALKVVLADKGSAPVLIFDEIDTGVGGAVADAMGRRLERLAKSVQVLSVTHAPQVAARASQHMLIEKNLIAGGDMVNTQVRELENEARGEEIARMLAGAKVSDEARAAARRLLLEVG
ncbi:DNA repair protein RecN [hydrothermal vent metagenome]|uniref:DNA repair protein RecN n=1 Tax=hydrothermal vent metagenome TaxID=652676 RepID=A0A3B0UW23_9ZZZZ